MSVNMPQLSDLLTNALVQSKVHSAALISTSGSIIVAASVDAQARDRRSILMSAAAIRMWDEADGPGEQTDEFLGNVYMEPVPRPSSGQEGAAEEPLFLVVLSGPPDASWDLLKERGHALATYFGRIFGSYGTKMVYSPAKHIQKKTAK